MSVDTIINGGLLSAIAYLCLLVTQHGPKLDRNTAAQEKNTEAQTRLVEELQNVKRYRVVPGFRSPAQENQLASRVPRR